MFEITIKNWKKFNPRKDVKHTSWVRIEISIFDDPELKHFTLPEVATWIWLITRAGGKNDGNIFISDQSLDSRITPELFRSTLAKLSRIKVIAVKEVSEEAEIRVTDASRARDGVTHPSRHDTERYDTIRNETGENARAREEAESEKPKTAPLTARAAIPENYRRFNIQFDTEKQDLIRKSISAIEAVVGRRIEPSFRRRMPEVLDEFEWNLSTLCEFLAEKDSEWEPGSPPQYREVALKRAFGLISEPGVTP